jgi:hypothetical protein
MEIDIPEVVAELTAAFEEYEHALLSNQPDVLIRLFLARSAHNSLWRGRDPLRL